MRTSPTYDDALARRSRLASLPPTGPALVSDPAMRASSGPTAAVLALAGAACISRWQQAWSVTMPLVLVVHHGSCRCKSACGTPIQSPHALGLLATSQSGAIHRWLRGKPYPRWNSKIGPCQFHLAGGASFSAAATSCRCPPVTYPTLKHPNRQNETLYFGKK